MELDQWIALYGAVSRMASDRERSLWSLFTAGLIGCGLLLAVIAFAGTAFGIPGGDSSFQYEFGIGVAALGALLSCVWLISQLRLHVACRHWQRLLRSIESQFAGAEFTRSFHRLFHGDQVCIPSASWICREWHPEPARIRWPMRGRTSLLTAWIPLAFLLAFAAVLCGILLK
ncbi:MAG: hypothetical protein JSW65_00865 [Candidatus Bipolaricaulota bacterium]|nr:MAG: hypothetical protein JSW65_00865 [Candidatus Bipolaricaulota bacterium]